MLNFGGGTPGIFPSVADRDAGPQVAPSLMENLAMT